MQPLPVYFRLFFNLMFSSPNCLLCRQPSHRAQLLCLGCERDLPWLQRHCHQCAEPLPSTEYGVDSADESLCGQCLKKPPAFDHTVAPLLYQFPVNNIIHRFKHNADINSTQLLCRLFIQQLGSHHARVDRLPQLLIPVPLHPRRLYQRGFNQSSELAHRLGQQLQISVNDLACHRVIDTPHQQGLTAKQRRQNLRLAFSVDHQQLRREGNIDHIALIDDVMTTGSTAQILAQQFKRAGVEQIDIWCLARTPAGRNFQSKL